MADYRLFLPVFLLIILSFGSVFGDTGSLTVVAGKSFQINYDAKDVQVLGVQPNKEDQGLIFSIQSTSPVATLEMTLPRELLDATTKDGSDDKFIVLVDETFTSYLEKSSSQTSRTILIQLAPENKELEVIGTHLASSESTMGNTQTTTPQIPIPNQSSQQENQLQQQMQNEQSEQKSSETTSEKSSENSQNISAQELSKIFPFKLSNLPFNIPSKQIIEYSVIASAILILIIVITSTKKSKARKQVRK